MIAGAGGRISFVVPNLVTFIGVCLSKRSKPSGFEHCLAFQVVVAMIEATDSFKHFRPALYRTSSDLILSLIERQLVTRSDIVGMIIHESR